MTRDIERTMDLDASAADVFRALSEGDEIRKWFAPEARVTSGSERTIFVSWGEGMGAEEPITVFEPPRKLRYRFGENADDKTPLFVEWTIEPNGPSGSRVWMVHSGFGTSAASDTEYVSNERGWRIFLLNLKHYLDGHRGKRCTQSPFVIVTTAEREDVWGHVVALDRSPTKGAFTGQEEGKAYRLVLSPGRALSGTVEIFAPARDLALTIADIDEHDPRSLRGEMLTVASHDEGLLRISLEKTANGTMIYGVVLAYGDAADTAPSLAEDIEAALRTALQGHM